MSAPAVRGQGTGPNQNVRIRGGNFRLATNQEPTHQ